MQPETGSPSPENAPFRIAKFGGTSVATSERILNVVRLVTQEQEAHPGARFAVVTSALGGVTDQLLLALAEAEARSGEHRAILTGLRERHADALNELAADADHEQVRVELEAVFEEVDELLQGIALLRQSSPRFVDAVISAGERLAAPLVAAAFRAEGREALPLDARAFIRTDDAFGEAAVDFEATTRLIREAFDDLPDGTVPVVTGFIASTEDGVTTTLGRSGSDYTASILGAALEAEEVVIWTDVDGVLSADPRIVPEAFTLDRLTYREAAELAHFGAKVLHPRTMRPLERAGVALRIKNTLNPDADGTRILAEPSESASPVRAVTSARDVALVTLEGTGVIGVPDLTASTFQALAERGVPVLLIAQASSEGSLSFAVRSRDRDNAVQLLRRAFERECERGDLRGIRAEAGLALITAVGDGLRQAHGLAGKMFATLGRAHVNVRAIAEGSSDHNLACVVRDEDAVRAVQALHEAFALRRLRAHLAVVGAGTLGRRLLAMLAEQAPTLQEQHRLNLRLVGLADSRHLLWEEEGLPFDEAMERLDGARFPVPSPSESPAEEGGELAAQEEGASGEHAPESGGEQEAWAPVEEDDPSALLGDEAGPEPEGSEAEAHETTSPEAEPPPGGVIDALTERLEAARLERLILVDATPSQTVPRRYPDWLRSGIGVVTPNQRGNTLDAGLYEAHLEAAREGEAPYLYETTVGAGLSVLSTLRDLLRTGDHIRRIEGVLSGTLAFVFNAMRDGRSFSEAVHEAAERGLTESDPRADLAGEDVARKLLLLAREMGLRPERDAIQAQSLVPDVLREGSEEDFWRRLPEVDAFWARKQAEFASRGQQLQYVAVLSHEQIRAGVQAVPADSPLAGLRGASVLFAFHTDRYAPEPLVVRGPGANVDVTAAVLLADIVRAAEAMR